ncbi:glycosyltransferase family 2 protein [bacterium]|nr:glycosyltransferase family 2 protein [bacterium]
MSNKLSVIISTYNREKYLSYALQSLVKQTAKKDEFEVLIIDNNSTDNTKKTIKNYKKKLPLKYFLEKKQGVSHARNRGIKEAKYNFIAFLDDDGKASENWIKNALNIIKTERPQIFGGPIYPYYENSKPKWFKDIYEIRTNGKNIKKLNKKEYLSGSNIFFNKKIFKKIGLFDTNLGLINKKMSFGEETKLQLIANDKKIDRFYYPKLLIYHLTPTIKMKIMYIFKRYWAIQKSSIKIFKQKNYAYLLFGSIFKFLIGCIYLFILPIRNRKKYPLWQNYLIEKVIFNITYLGKIEGILSK